MLPGEELVLPVEEILFPGEDISFFVFKDILEFVEVFFVGVEFFKFVHGLCNVFALPDEIFVLGLDEILSLALIVSAELNNLGFFLDELFPLMHLEGRVLFFISQDDRFYLLYFFKEDVNVGRDFEGVQQLDVGLLVDELKTFEFVPLFGFHQLLLLVGQHILHVLKVQLLVYHRHLRRNSLVLEHFCFELEKGILLLEVSHLSS